jgi:hypothetical protein
MKPSEIIRADAIERKLDPDFVLRNIDVLLRNKDAIMLQKNDSILIVQKLQGNNATLHLFTEDSPLALAKAITYFMQVIKESDLRAVYGKTDNDEIVSLMRRIGVPVAESDKPGYNWMAFV